MTPVEQHPTQLLAPWDSLVTARVGIRYLGVPTSVIEEALRRPDVRLLDAYGAFGRKLYFGRDDGPWAPYDPELIDQNAEPPGPAGARPWPWCWGDEIWMLLRFQGHLAFVRIIDPDDGEFLLLSAVRTPSVDEARVELVRWGRQVAGELLGHLSAAELAFTGS